MEWGAAGTFGGFVGSGVLRLGRVPVVAGGGDVEPDATGDAGASGSFV